MENEVVAEIEVELEEIRNGTSAGRTSQVAKEKAETILSNIQRVVTYGIDDRPPWYSTIVLAFQHFLTDVASLFSFPLIIAQAMCIQNDLLTTSQLISTIFVVSGIQTFLQATFGSRLPIVQGPSFAFLLPLFSLLNLRGQCPSDPAIAGNATNLTESRLEFRDRMQELQGAVLVASFYEILVGFTGITSILLKFIGPLTIAPTIGLIGLSLFNVASSNASQHWGISAMTVFLIALFSQYLERFPIPCPGPSKSKGIRIFRFHLFTLFPVVISIMIAWLVCYILTVFDVFPEDSNAIGYAARTDIKSTQLEETPWFYVPYPGQWGLPRITGPGVLGMIAGCTASIVESIGDYFACAKLSGAPPPPHHAMNRGIGMEGIGGVISAFWGTGVGSTSYSQNIGTIGITKVGSRLVVQVMGVLVIVLGLWLKAAAFLATIPTPVIGGVMIVTYGIVSDVGFSNLQYVDMNSPRNLFILGFALYMGTAVPAFVNSNQDKINTGTPEERGLVQFHHLQGMEPTDSKGAPDDNPSDYGDRALQKEIASYVNKCYDFPFGMPLVRRASWTKYIPFCPTFGGYRVSLPKCFSKREKNV
ncbi:solute carrier family 23 member 1-like isoform X2 [Lytechinus pictus]|uniref:solute carrier family 23 member 1-like isoform X2 n=1 Tax=Lytechinus pictus TaxID=7653 RepID=UPI0030BA2355